MLFARVPAVLAAVGAAFAVVGAGCQAPGSVRSGSVPSGRVSSLASAQRDRSARTFTIVFSTFIPSNHLLAPRGHPQSYAYAGLRPPRRLAFAGDDRGFDPDAVCYRARQVVTIVPDQADDADGLQEGSKQNLGGRSESFVAAQALADGRIDARDRAGARGEGGARHEECVAGVEGMIIDDPVRLGPQTVSVRLRTAWTGGPRNRLVFGSPAIDWSFEVTIDTSGPEPTYRVVGAWDGYPAAELYINRQPVFRSTPGNRPGSFIDLMKLLPGHADVRFVTAGTLHADRGWPAPAAPAPTLRIRQAD